MVELIDFLKARLADDVAAVEGYVDAELDELRIANAGTATREEIMEFRADLRRALAEVEAKRRIIALVDDVRGDEDRIDGEWGTGRWERDAPDRTSVQMLIALSLPYLGHPDYREEWKP